MYFSELIFHMQKISVLLILRERIKAKNNLREMSVLQLFSQQIFVLNLNIALTFLVTK